MNLSADISTQLATSAFSGTSMVPEERAAQVRQEYAGFLQHVRNVMEKDAAQGNTAHLLEEEWSRFRAGYRKVYTAWLSSRTRIFSAYIAGPSNYPVRQQRKRMDVEQKRSNEVQAWRERALAAVKRNLRPDLQPIRTEDSNATERLEDKIAKAEALQDLMRDVNATIRKHKKAGPEAQIVAVIAITGWPRSAAEKILQPDFCGRIGFADYELTNNNANIRRMKQRLEQVTAQQAAPAQETEGERARVEDCPADNRIRVWFPGKPDEATRTDLKRNGFRWTPSLGAWQAFRNYNAQQAAMRIAGVTATV